MRNILFLLLFCLPLLGISQDFQVIDSLRQEARNADEKYDRIDANLRLCTIYENINPDTAMQYVDKAISLAQDKEHAAMLSRALNQKGTVFRAKAQYGKALEFHQKALSIAEDLGQKMDIAKIHNNIGIVFYHQGNRPKTLEYFQKSYNALMESRDSASASIALNNIGGVYQSMDSTDQALAYFESAYEFSIQLKDEWKQAVFLTSIGQANVQLENYELGIAQLKESYRMKQGTPNLKSLMYNIGSIGQAYMGQGLYDSALVFLEETLEFSQTNGFPELESNAYEIISNIYEAAGQVDSALLYYKRYTFLNDSLRSAQGMSDIAEMTAKYQNDRREKEVQLREHRQELEIAKKDKQLAEDEEQLAKDRQERIILFCLIGALLVVAIFIFRSNLVKRRDNAIINEQKSIVEQKNLEITQSITYARRIQQAILPTDEELNRLIPDSVVFYKPKDIVAGDFYWLHEADSWTIFAAADCTGHGVPGAMVSVVCFNALNRAVREYNLTDPAAILDKVADLVSEHFSTGDENVRDGMDIALCALNRTSGELVYAGANNPLWVIKGSGELQEVRADKQPIGAYSNRSPFTSHSLTVEPGDFIYSLTDGFVDQFGGPKGKKFQPKRLKELLLSMVGKSAKDQMTELESQLSNWKGGLEQVDDICIVGVRV